MMSVEMLIRAGTGWAAHGVTLYHRKKWEPLATRLCAVSTWDRI